MYPASQIMNHTSTILSGLVQRYQRPLSVLLSSSRIASSLTLTPSRDRNTQFRNDHNRWKDPYCVTLRQISTTSSLTDLQEFFDEPRNWGERKVRSGRPWRMDELRLKSNSDLHKLWYVLYKERNMLYTMQEAAESEKELFPSPERIDKVEESMANLENVVRERNKAYWQLEVSPCATGERPAVFRRDVFGRHKWMKCSQHLVPYKSNWHFRNSKGTGNPDETEGFFRRYREMKRKEYNEERRKIAKNLREIFRRFPNADVDYIAETHPMFPPGYVRHLKENIHLYRDPPTPLTRDYTVAQHNTALRESEKSDRLLE